MKGVYLGCCKAEHRDYDLDYNDIVAYDHVNLLCDMMEVDIDKYDYVIASPPCNYYSRANYRRESSYYAQLTKHLFPDILYKLCSSTVKYWLVKNVISPKFFRDLGLFELPCFVYFIGRHTYWSNINFCGFAQDFHQLNDFKHCIINGKKRQIELHHEADIYGINYRQGGYNVHIVVEEFLKYINLLENC